MKLDMKRFAAHTLLLASLALAGCSASVPAPKMAHVRTETVSHVILFHEGAMQIYPSEQDSLASFISTIPTDAVSYVALATDDTNPRAVARARNVRNYLIAQGFSVNAVRLQPTPGIDPLTVVMNVQYAKAVSPEPCPDWSKDSVKNYENTNASNFGCAYYNNLIVQLANPADYNSGHGKAAYDGQRDSVITERYLSGTSSGSSGGSASSSGSSASGGGSTTTTTSSP